MGDRDFRLCARVASEAHSRQGWSITDWHGQAVDPHTAVVLETEGTTGVVEKRELSPAILRRYLWERRTDRALLRPTGCIITEVWGSESRMMLGAVVSPLTLARLELVHGQETTAQH